MTDKNNKALEALDGLEERYAELYGHVFSDYDKSVGKELIDTIRSALTAAPQVGDAEVREAIRYFKEGITPREGCEVTGLSIHGRALKLLETLIAVASRPMPDVWQPIESAPRDADYIMGINMRGKSGQPFIMRSTFVPDEKYTHANPEACWSEKFAEWPCYPTHWMPLPQPPKVKIADHVCVSCGINTEGKHVCGVCNGVKITEGE